ncbi:MAG: asparagine synthase (glutamine-hydrolyzing) [Bacteroidia bacterium]
MCGISGVISFRNDIDCVKAVQLSNGAIKHRGPDGEGFAFFKEGTFVAAASDDTQREILNFPLSFCPSKHINEISSDHTIALGHRRLSIIDLAPSGHQPMCDETENYWITYNGEIYNYIEIRLELEKAGYVFRTQSDTEVILQAYKHWGKSCLDKFNGMWAFALYDRKEQKLFAARDRFGVKPFYYYFKEDLFCFASEQKAIHALPFVKTSLNNKAVYDFFVHSELEHQEEGFFTDIMELSPSYYLELDTRTKELKTEPYYSLKVNTKFEEYDNKKFNLHRDEIEHLFYTAVKLRLRSDVPVGSCLSGGIDSSAIVAITNDLNKKTNTSVNLFSAVFPDESIDESKWAKLVASNTHSQWHTVTPQSGELVSDLQDLIYSQDIPLWSSSTYAQYRVMKLARDNNIKVVLDGQGGDELFAGYLPYFTWYWRELFNNKKFALLRSEMKEFDSGGKSLTYYTKERLKQKISRGKLSLLNSIKNKDLVYYNKDFYSHFRNEDKKVRGQTPDPETLNEKLLNEFHNTRLKGYLKCEDRCGMRWGVESRTPFADDIHLIEKAFSIPAIYKMKNGTTKHLLREALKPYLPNEIYRRKDKMGYVTPNNKWLYEARDKIKPLITDNINEFIDSKKLLRDFDHLLKNPEHLSSGAFKKENPFLFKTLAFSVWRAVFKM